MSTTTRAFSGLAATKTGQSRQLDRIFKNMTANMKKRQTPAEPVSDYDALIALPRHNLANLVLALRQDLADKEALIEDMRAHTNNDFDVSPSAATTEYWDTATVARKSNVSISTICRNAAALNGKKMGGDWLFPSGTVYGKRRKSK